MKIKLKFIIIVAVVVLTAIIVLHINNEKSPEEITIITKSPEDISRIEVITEEPLFANYSRNIIDFSTNTVTANNIESGVEKEQIIHFSDENKKKFVRRANIHGFFNWKEHYESTVNGDNDSMVYSIYITYSNGSEQEIFFQIPDTPDTFKAMQKVFYETFNCYII